MEQENQEKTEKKQIVNGRVIDEIGRSVFAPGFSGNPNGRPKESEEKKAERKSRKQLIEEYKEALASYLPAVEPIFMAKVMTGDVQAVKEYHDRVMDKAKQATDITTGGERIGSQLTDEEKEKLLSLLK